MHVNKRQPAPLAKGYLLLEITLAIAITGLILTSLFQITEWNLKVASNAMESSNSQMKEAAFFSFFDRVFRSLPGDAAIQLTSTETASHYLSEIIIQDSGEIFSWPGQPFTPSAVKVVTKKNRDNTIDVLLEYYEFPLIKNQNVERDSEDIVPNQQPLQTLILLDDIWRFEWRAWDGKNYDRGKNLPLWNYDWPYSNTPRYFELNIVFNPKDKQVVHTFWNPSKINPESHFNTIIENGAQRAAATSQANSSVESN